MQAILVEPITSTRSTRLGADYIYEDSGSCVSGEEEGGIVYYYEEPEFLPAALSVLPHSFLYCCTQLIIKTQCM